jgi:hypothetical protein
MKCNFLFFIVDYKVYKVSFLENINTNGSDLSSKSDNNNETVPQIAHIDLVKPVY